MTEDDLHAALVRSRVAVEEYIERTREQLSEYHWEEEQATTRLLDAAHPRVRYVPFTRNQEGGNRTNAGTGADWLWWWMAPTGECFGMLTQAKNLKKEHQRWHVDLRYHDRRQITDLLNASDILRVPAVYVLYCGGPAYRPDLICGMHTADASDPCQRSAVSVLPGLVANQIVVHASLDWPGESGVDAYQSSIPLEDLADLAIGSDVVPDLNLGHIDGELYEFLTQSQTGVRAVAKKIFSGVSRMRSGQFSLAVAERTKLGTDVVFDELPIDEGHFGVPYFDHIFRGLRPVLPDYLTAIANGHEAPEWLADRVTGIVFVDVT
jgi:hypothetical protein